MHRAVEICKIDMRLSCGDLALLENACYEAAQFRKNQGKLCAEKYMAMKKRLAEISCKLDKTIVLKAECFASRKSKKQRSKTC